MFPRGWAIGSEQLVQFNDTGGDHDQLVMSAEPVVLRIAVEPRLTVISVSIMFNRGNGNTCTVTKAESGEHPWLSFPVTKYVVVVDGAAIGLAIRVFLN